LGNATNDCQRAAYTKGKEAKSMRYLMAWIVAIPCGMALGQEALVRLPEPPHVLVQDQVVVVPSAAPSYDKFEHLLKAADHLEAAGLRENATKLRQQAEQESHVLKNELESLRAEVHRLRQPASETRQVAVHLKLMEVSLNKIRRLGFSFSKVTGPNAITTGAAGTLASEAINTTVTDGTTPWSPTVGSGIRAFGIVNGNNSFFGVLEALRQDKLARVLAEPTIVTVSGRAASFRTGGSIPLPGNSTDGKGPVEFVPYGTAVDLAPVILSDGTVRIDLRAEFSEPDVQRTVQVQNVAVPGVRSRNLDTQVVIPSGQTLVIGGLVQRRAANQPETKHGDSSQLANEKAGSDKEASDEFETFVLITPEIVEGASASNASLKR
jgi:Flp pilus assembly secretin CpaC